MLPFKPVNLVPFPGKSEQEKERDYAAENPDIDVEHHVEFDWRDTRGQPEDSEHVQDVGAYHVTHGKTRVSFFRSHRGGGQLRKRGA